MKKINNFEKAVFLLNFVAYVVLLCFEFSWLNIVAFVSSALFIFSNLLVARGSWLGFLFSVISYVVYCVSCVFYAYYGELAYSVVIIIMQFFVLFNWKKNKTKEDCVNIKRLGIKEIVVSLIVSLFVTVAAVFVLKALNGSQVILNAVSCVFTLTACYYAFRRSYWQFIVNIISGVAFIALWLITVIEGNFDGLIYLVGGVFNLVWAIYGWINWLKIEKAQDGDLKNSINPNIGSKI